jgi:hypothetical protein
MPSEAKFEQFWAGHRLSTSIAKATLAFFDRVAPDLYGPALPFTELETFRRDVRAAYETAFAPDNVKPPRPALKLVTGD